MKDDLIILFAGAILGFLSTIVVELIRNRIEKNRLEHERARESLEEREKEVREFLSPGADRKIAPAWLTLIETNHPFFQKSQTKESSKIDLHENARRGANRESESSTLEKYLLTQTQIIGRQADCEIRLDDAAISRLHAMIRFENGDFVIYDLASKSGSFVNDTRVNKNGMVLHSGDHLKIGDSVLVFDGYLPAQADSDGDKRNEAVITKPAGQLGLRSKKKKS